MDKIFICGWIIQFILFLSYVYGQPLSSAKYCDVAVFCQESERTELLCNTCIPRVVPSHIRQVIITNNSAPVDNTSFSDSSWRSVQHLEVSGSATTHFIADTFINLRSLTHLYLHLLKVGLDSDTSNATYWKLTHLKTLDLSNCGRLSFETLFKLFKIPSNFPSLRTLMLFKYNAYRYGQPLDLNSTFLDFLAVRNVTTLQIGDTLVNSFYMNPLHPICSSLQTLTWKGPVINRIDKFNNNGVCKSLRRVLLSYINPMLHALNNLLIGELRKTYNVNKYNETLIVITDTAIKNAKHTYKPTLTFDLTDNQRFNRYTHYFANVEELTISHSSGGVRLPENIRIVIVYNGSLILNAKAVRLRYNNITYLDAEFRTNLLINVNDLDLSNNNMIYLGAGMFTALYSLKLLNLANNKLHKMERTLNCIQLLWDLENLEHLDISNNGFTILPKDFFLKNEKLRTVILSQNRLTEFEYKGLRNIVFLSLRDNKFSQLDSMSRSCIDRLRNINKNFSLDFRDNPLQCSCDTLPFLKWSVKSPFLQMNNTRCSVNNVKKHIDESTIASVESMCDNPANMKRMILIGSLVATGIIITGAISGIATRRLYRLRLRKSRRKETVKQLKDNTFEYSFVLFLSYSSENDELILNDIYPAITESLTGIARNTSTDWQPICIGDRHFRPGFSIYQEAYRCLGESAVVLAAVSRAYCSSVHCRNELEQAMYMDKPIILLFLEAVEVDQMNYIVQQLFNKNARAKVEAKNGSLQFTPNVTDLCLSALELVN